MVNQTSDIIGRAGSIGRDIETGGSPHHSVDQIEMTTLVSAGGGGGGGATEEFAAGQQSVQRKSDSGIFRSISAATLSVAAAAILGPPPRGLHSEDLLYVAYTLDLITLLVLSILLFALALALALIPDNWVSAVRAAAATVTLALLVLLLFLVAFVSYGLLGQGLP